MMILIHCTFDWKSTLLLTADTIAINEQITMNFEAISISFFFIALHKVSDKQELNMRFELATW